MTNSKHLNANKNIFKSTKNDNNEPKSVVYEIPCKGCYKTYVGETGRGVDVRLKETSHLRDFIIDSWKGVFALENQ